jgi:flavin-dependent dehydrogenase
VAGRGLFLLGDAAGYIEPFTGEGMAWALGSAVALAPLADRAAAGWHPGLARAWARRHRQLVARRQVVCRVAAAVLRRARLTAALVAALSWLPGLAAPVVAYLNRP